MAIRHMTAKTFWPAYNKLPRAIQARADKQFSLLQQDPHHPSLQFKKLGERHDGGLWSARVTDDYRALAIRSRANCIWVWIGDHKAYLGILAR